MSTKPDTRVREPLVVFGPAALVTHTATGGVRGRPMAPADVGPDGTTLLATDPRSAKITARTR